MDMLINRVNGNLDPFDEEDIEAMEKVGINTYRKMSSYQQHFGGTKIPERYIRNFNYDMIEKLLNLFGSLIIHKNEIKIYDDYVE